MVSKAGAEDVEKETAVTSSLAESPPFVFPLFLIAFLLFKESSISHVFWVPQGSLCLLWDALLLFYLILQNYRIYGPLLAWFNNYFQMKNFFLWGDGPCINLINKRCQRERRPSDSAV